MVNSWEDHRINFPNKIGPIFHISFDISHLPFEALQEGHFEMGNECLWFCNSKIRER